MSIKPDWCPECGMPGSNGFVCYGCLEAKRSEDDAPPCPDCGAKMGYSPMKHQKNPYVCLIPHQIEKAQCTLCAKVDCSGFYTGCMVEDMPDEDFQGWKCDGNGNLTRVKKVV